MSSRYDYEYEDGEDLDLHVRRGRDIPQNSRYVAPVQQIRDHVYIDRQREREVEFRPLRAVERIRDKEVEREYEYDHHVSRDRQLRREHRRELGRAGEKMRYEAHWYPQPIKEFLQPVIQNERAMKSATEEFLRLDKNPDYLAESSTRFLEGLGSVQDELDEQTVNLQRDSDSSSEEDDSGADLEPRLSGLQLGDRPKQNGFMNWQSFHEYPLSEYQDCVDDRRKSLISFWQAIKLGIPTPIGSVNVDGLLGLLARVLQPQDYRAYFKSTPRSILLPDFMGERQLTSREKDVFELNLFDTTNFTGGSSTMTCLTYSDSDYGTISQFKVNLTRTEDGEWPQEIKPVAVMTRVPKKVLKMMVKSVPKSKTVQLQVKTKAKSPLRWVTKMPDGETPGPGWSPNVRQCDLSAKLHQALAIEPEDLKISNGEFANYLHATIPAMIAWLHVKAPYVTEIDIEGTEFVRGRRIVSWKDGPAIIGHEGNNPTIVVLHPRGGDWVTAPVYWGS